MKRVGSKREVFNGKADHTKGKLTKDDLIKNKRGRIVSKRKSEANVKNAERLKPFQFKKKT
jgi:hypothetical protein